MAVLVAVTDGHRDQAAGDRPLQPVHKGWAPVREPRSGTPLWGHSPLYGGLCQAAGVATVTSGHSTKADVLCQMA